MGSSAPAAAFAVRDGALLAVCWWLTACGLRRCAEGGNIGSLALAPLDDAKHVLRSNGWEFALRWDIADA